VDVYKRGCTVFQNKKRYVMGARTFADIQL
jgi:hypothetical protein